MIGAFLHAFLLMLCVLRMNRAMPLFFNATYGAVGFLAAVEIAKQILPPYE